MFQSQGDYGEVLALAASSDNTSAVPGSNGNACEEMEEAAELLRALSHPVRLKIVDLLSEGESCVKRLEELLGIPQPSVSQHLSRLRYAGIIESERKGHLVCYRLVESRGSKILKAALGRSGRR